MVKADPHRHADATTKMNRCLISGASGFIGQQLAKLLTAHDCFVRGFARNTRTTNLACDEFLQADICVPESLPAVTENIDTLFHLAGSAQAEKNDTQLHHRLHVEGSRNLLAAAQASGIKRIIYFSSVKAINPVNDAYGLAKFEAEQLIRTLSAESNTDTIILRPCAVYGPGGKGLLSTLLKAIDYGYMPALPDTHNKRSLIHVEDLVQAAFLAAQKSSPECPVYTITDGQAYSSRQIQQLMCQASNKRTVLLPLPFWLWKTAALSGDCLHYLIKTNCPFNSAILARLLESAEYDGDVARQALGFKACHTLASALPEIISHHRNSVKA